MELKYHSGFKYQVAEDYVCRTRIVGYNCETDYLILEQDGTLTIKKGYAWDGCSGPTIDDSTNMRGGLEHDSKYQLMRLGVVPESCKTIADAELRERCIEDGMWRIRAWYYFEGVDHFAKFACKYGTEQAMKKAP